MFKGQLGGFGGMLPWEISLNSEEAVADLIVRMHADDREVTLA